MSALMLFVLLVMILLFSMLTSIPYALTLSTSLLVRFWTSPLLPPIRLMLSANCRFHMGLPPLEMDVWWSCSVSCMIFSRNKLNWMGERVSREIKTASSLLKIFHQIRWHLNILHSTYITPSTITSMHSLSPLTKSRKTHLHVQPQEITPDVESLIQNGSGTLTVHFFSFF